MGQSGGGYAVVSQLAPYDGNAEGLFQKAIARSIQRSPMFEVSELADRNDQYFKLLNCTAGQPQLDCFRKCIGSIDRECLQQPVELQGTKRVSISPCRRLLWSWLIEPMLLGDFKI